MPQLSSRVPLSTTTRPLTTTLGRPSACGLPRPRPAPGRHANIPHGGGVTDEERPTLIPRTTTTLPRTTHAWISLRSARSAQTHESLADFRRPYTARSSLEAPVFLLMRRERNPTRTRRTTIHLAVPATARAQAPPWIEDRPSPPLPFLSHADMDQRMAIEDVAQVTRWLEHIVHPATCGHSHWRGFGKPFSPKLSRRLLLHRSWWPVRPPTSALLPPGFHSTTLSCDLLTIPTWQGGPGLDHETRNHGKIHQNSAYQYNLKVAQKKRLQFYQTRSNTIILYNPLPAVCIEKVVIRKSGEEVYSKTYQKRKHPSTITAMNAKSTEKTVAIAIATERLQNTRSTTQLFKKQDDIRRESQETDPPI